VSIGTFRIYLGAAPGVGKTYAMLNEGWRARERGRDVVVAFVETHGRPSTAAQVRQLEVVPRRVVSYRGQEFEEMDLDAVLARRPAIALVDELAHTNIEGSRNAKRWQDVEELLAAGISVLSTVNIQHLESLNDVVSAITGVRQRETLPDGVVRAADQIELVDMSPESLRRRMAHGNIYRSERVDAALGNYFRVGNLTALRELALLWVADRVDDGLKEYRQRHGIAEPWETKERVVVALTGAAGGAGLIRRGARMAARVHADLVGVHIRSIDGLAQSAGSTLSAQRALLDELGGRFAEVAGTDVARDLVAFARAENATQLLLGATDRSRLAEVFKGSVINDVIRLAGGLDVHVIGTTKTDKSSSKGEDSSGSEADTDRARQTPSTERLAAGGKPISGRLPRLPSRRRLATLSVRRRIIGWVLSVVALPVLVLALIPVRMSLSPTGTLPLVLLGVVIVATVGGLLPAVVGALVGFGFADWFLVPPVNSLTINRGGDAAALVVFVLVGVTVALSIDRLARQSIVVARVRAEAETLARLVGSSPIDRPGLLQPVVDDLRATFGADSVAVFQLLDSPNPPQWKIRFAAGQPLPAQPEDGDFFEEISPGLALVVKTVQLSADDRRLLNAFVAYLRNAQSHERLAETAASAQALSEANELRTALLAAVSHDLRTPLASIKACATSLLSEEVQWDGATIHGFVSTIDAEADRLNRLVGNLLDMSRLQTGVLTPRVEPTGYDEVVAAALASLSGSTSMVNLDVAETLSVDADPALLERALANLIANALAWSPPGAQVRIEASYAPPDDLQVRLSGDASRNEGRLRAELRVIDVGPGIPPEVRDAVFRPFQRLGDGNNSSPTGVGLGLAVARGFIEAMGGELTLEDTPGGGLTAVVTMPATVTDSLHANPGFIGTTTQKISESIVPSATCSSE
jgi:two-component system sensor histidine kinase KdpD